MYTMEMYGEREESWQIILTDLVPNQQDSGGYKMPPEWVNMVPIFANKPFT